MPRSGGRLRRIDLERSVRGGSEAPAGATASAAGTSVPGARFARRSNRSSRATRPAGFGSVSGIVARTSASSSERRGEVVHRMSFWAVSSSERMRANSLGRELRRPGCAGPRTHRPGCRAGPPDPGAVFTRSRLRKCPSACAVTLRMSWPSCTSRLTVSKMPRASPTAIASASSCWTSSWGAPSRARTASSSTVGAAQHARLVQHRQRVARRALCLPGDRVSGLVGELHALRTPRSSASCAARVSMVSAAEVESLAAADDRDRHLLRLGGGQHEAHARRRLLEHLQQRVECRGRQPLSLVDDVDLLAALHRRGGRLLAELASVLDATVRSGVDLDDVEVRALSDGDALSSIRRRARRWGPVSQLTILARIRAVEVLPVPRGPQKRNAWCRRPSRIAPVSARTTWSCPRTSAGVCGRYRRYKAWCCFSSAICPAHPLPVPGYEG